jgi:hypothetical protein
MCAGNAQEHVCCRLQHQQGLFPVLSSMRSHGRTCCGLMYAYAHVCFVWHMCVYESVYSILHRSKLCYANMEYTVRVHSHTHMLRFIATECAYMNT